jgi:hypothetical protein
MNVMKPANPHSANNQPNVSKLNRLRSSVIAVNKTPQASEADKKHVRHLDESPFSHDFS